MAEEVEVKKQTRRARKTKKEATPEVAPSGSAKSVESKQRPKITKLPNGLVIVSN